ncbi:hypothetical protein KAR91_46650, partial [Candidatus Pacearchaeota archaeon]|nr:hypothetical protein [Candidatus Pacearchaeota archaeon]
MRRIFVFLILICFVFIFACSEDAEEKTVVVNVPVETPTSEPSSEDPASDPVAVPIVIPVAQLLTKVNIETTDTLAIKPRSVQLSNYSASISGNVVGSTCDELGSLDSAYEELTFEGSTPCFSEVEIWEDNNVYAEFSLQDQSLVLALANIITPVKFNILIDPNGDVHYLPGKPIKRNTFKNAKLIKSHDSKPHYINSSNKLVRFDMTSDTEVVLVDEPISNFSIKNYSNGDHFIIDASDDVKRINPDGNQEVLGEITKGQWYDIGGSIQYVTGGYLKNMIFDNGGNITDRAGRSNPVEFNAWIVSGIGGMPRGINFNYSISGCSNDILNSQNIMICNGKPYSFESVNKDVKELNTCDYGHCGILTTLTIKSCTSNNYLYFYAEGDGID